MRTWNRLRILFWRPVCWIRGTHRAQPVKVLPVRGFRTRRVVQAVCIHCGYSLEVSIEERDVPTLTDENTDTLKLGSRARVPFKKRIRWLLNDLARVT